MHGNIWLYKKTYIYISPYKERLFKSNDCHEALERRHTEHVYLKSESDIAFNTPCHIVRITER